MPNIKSGKVNQVTRMPGSGRFLYRSVSRALRERIDNGSYEPDARIPSVDELAAEFGVSTITVRRAIRDLSLEGLLVGRQGLGVFVASKRRIVRSLRPDRIPPVEDEMRKAGIEPGIQDISATLVSADSEPASRAFGRRGGAVYKLERILLGNGEPVGLDTLWLPRRIGELLGPRLHGHFIISQLESHGIVIDHIDYEFEAATATEEQASLLDVVTGFPLLVIQFKPMGPTGAPLLIGRTTTRADRFIYKFYGRSGGQRRQSARPK